MITIPKEVKQLLRQDGSSKNLRISFPNGEHEDITNSELNEDTFSFTESICSRDTLKFGLCEASMVEFETVGVGNIKGCGIEVYAEIDISSLPDDFIAEYGTTSEDVPFPYYRIPYGKFTVDSCPRQSDMTKRKVTAYTADMQNGIPLTAVEKAKQKSFVRSNTAYEVDLIPFLFSNLPGFKYDESYFDITEVSIETGEELLFSKVNMIFESTLVSVEGGIIAIKPGSEAEKGLIRLNYNKVSDFDAVKKEIIQELSGRIQENAIGPFVTMYDEPSGDYEILTFGTKKVNPVSVDGLVYPYISGKSIEYDDRGYFNIFLPKTLTITRSGEAGTSKKTWTLADSYSAQLLTPIDGLFNPTLTFARTKESSKHFNFQGKINLTGYVTAWLELNALFGKYARSGGLELVNLQSRMELYPSEYLYPSEDLYPIDSENEEPTSELITEDEYASEGFWYEEYQVQPFGKVAVDYVDPEGNKQTYAYQFDADAPNIYYMDNNEIFKTVQMSEADVKTLLDTYFISNANDMVFTPIELKMRGRPDIEAGDFLDIVSKEGNVFSFVFRRTISGIQNLTDDVETECDEINEDTTDTSLLVEGESS